MIDAQEPVIGVETRSIPSPTSSKPRGVTAWQRRLLPFMIGAVVLLGAAFFTLSVLGALQMSRFLTEDPHKSISDRVSTMLAADEQQVGRADVMQHGLLMLEADVLEKRYRQASALLMSRIWTRQLAFNTGMVLALIGAVFIIGKLSEASSKLGFEGSGAKASIDSASPGLILAFMGVILMAIALIVQPKIEVEDRAIYFQASPNPKANAIVVGVPAQAPNPDPDPGFAAQPQPSPVPRLSK